MVGSVGEMVGIVVGFKVVDAIVMQNSIFFKLKFYIHK